MNEVGDGREWFREREVNIPFGRISKHMLFHEMQAPKTFKSEVN